MEYEKKYKDLVEAVKMLKEANPSDEGIQNWVKDNVPELKESEDERMKRELIAHFRNNSVSETWSGLNVKKVIAWLEKQGEPSDKTHYWTEEEIEPIISDYLRGAEHYGGMIGRLRCLKPKSLEKQGEKKPIDYNEELKKCRENPLYFFDKYVKLKEQKPAWSEEDEDKLNSCINAINAVYKWDVMINWLKSLKERMKGE